MEKSLIPPKSQTLHTEATHDLWRVVTLGKHFHSLPPYRETLREVENWFLPGNYCSRTNHFKQGARSAAQPTRKSMKEKWNLHLQAKICTSFTQPPDVMFRILTGVNSSCNQFTKSTQRCNSNNKLYLLPFYMVEIIHTAVLLTEPSVR